MSAASHPREPALGATLSRLGIPLLTGLAFFSFAYNQSASAGAAESRYLALLTIGVLAAIAFLAPRPAWELHAGALLSTTVLWIVDYGPHRGAVLTLLLTACLFSAAYRQRHTSQIHLALPLAYGVQLLGRCDLLLPPLFDLRTLVSLLLLPAVAGYALVVLQKQVGRTRALTTGAVIFVLAPGWNVTTCLGLMALAGGALLSSRDEPYIRRWMGLGALMAAVLVKGSVGALSALAGLTLALPRRQIWVPTAAAVLIGLLLGDAADWENTLASLSPLALLLPALPWAALRRPDWVLTGLVIAASAGLLGGGRDALAVGLGLIAMALPAEGAITRLQATWAVAMAGGALLHATYPWVRPDPFADTLSRLNLSAQWESLWWILPTLALLGLLMERVGRARWAPGILGCLLFVALAANLPRPGQVPIRFQEVVLDAERPRWVHSFPVTEISRIVADTNLVRGADVPTGTRAGEIRLLDEAGKILGRIPLEVGTNTGEWAAEREDVAGRPGFRAPEPFLAYVAPDGGFFGRRYRALSTRPPRGTIRPAQIMIRRNPSLPPEVRLVIYRLELRS